MKEKVLSTTDASKSRSKKWFTPYKSKENRGPSVGDDKRGTRAQKKMTDVRSPRSTRRTGNSKSKKLTLIQEFDEIVRSAQSVAASPPRAPKPSSVCKVSSPSQKLVRKVLHKQNHIIQEDSPERPGSLSSHSVAPSPATPPLPQKLPLLKEKEDDHERDHPSSPLSMKLNNVVHHPPSPQGMNISNLNDDESFSFVTQSEFLRRAESNDEEPPFLDAEDTSLNASGLDLDNLIDEIFTNNSMSNDQENVKQDHVVLPHSPGQSLDCVLHCSGGTLKLSEQKEDNCVKDTEENCVNHSEMRDSVMNHRSSEVGIEKEKEIFIYDENDSSNVPLSPVIRLIRSEPLIAPDTMKELTAGKTNEEASNIKNQEGKDGHVQSASVLNEIDKSEKDLGSSPSMKQAAIEGETQAPANSEDAILPNSINESDSVALGPDEAFCEDLSLSHSQFLDIDAKCGLLEDIPANQSGETMLASISASASLQQPPNYPNVSFTIPPAPKMEWIQKALDGRRRLQNIAQEISRLK